MIRTAVRGVLSVAHHDAAGRLHGHTYEVWVRFPRGDAAELRAALDAVLGRWDHGLLPDDVAQAEDLAAVIAAFLPACDHVRVERWVEGIIAEWWR